VWLLGVVAAAALSDALSEVVARQGGQDRAVAPTGYLDESRGVAGVRADALLDAVASPGSEFCLWFTQAA
jgi:hypothetical protein